MTTPTTCADYGCMALNNRTLTVWISTRVGPRIVGLAVKNGANLLAELPYVSTTRPDGQVYQFKGGHRLWHSPEDLQRTYIPDDAPVEITRFDEGVTMTQPVEAETGIKKTMSIRLDVRDAGLTIDHSLTNHGLWPIELAPWGITQLRAGGVAILPQPTTATGLLPNRRLSLWPYTDIASPHIRWGNRYIFIQATMQQDALKIGWANPAGWQAYHLDNTLFVKQANYQPNAVYPDFGSNAECYCDPRFLELETLGPLTTLAPGQAVTHRETWHVFPDIDRPQNEDDVAALLESLGLGA